ncbi:DUF4349 domain-containing protein [Capillimicrobium parvum]|uniref:DUF4349 domain-containing protein n=1 Tax=Capillimicrobium parvum TaxID=2884022 RepID=A0A9E7C775_9ACTN|nr:DUF4349 domain-containing protein [Capillimicrobium parvum]UGS39178.1 hypothetical protein DSM104329_05610 [Capillimicrobium parvum]
MSRRDPTLDPVAARELEALEAALRGDAVEPDLSDLAVLAEDLQAVTPRPSEDFTARLDERAAAGFPQAGSAAGAQPRRLRRWPAVRVRLFTPLAARSLAAAVVVVVVAAALLSGGGSGGGTASDTIAAGGDASTATSAAGAESSRDGAASPSSSAPSTSSGEQAAPPSSAQSGSGGTLGSATAPGSSSGAGTEPGRRRVERTADLEVSVARDRFDEAAARVPQIAAGADAIVETSSVSTAAGDGRATFSLRVPVGGLEQTLADLSELGRVESRHETGVDVTGAFVSASDRLGDLVAERSSVRRRLAAETDTEAANRLRDRLDELQREIASARATMATMRERTSYARVSFDLTTSRDRPGGGAGDGSDQGWTIGDALSDAGSILAGVAGGLIVGLAVGAPLIVLLAALLVWRGALRRRRRERALGPA